MKLFQMIVLLVLTTFFFAPAQAQERTSLPFTKDPGVLKLEKLIEERRAVYQCSIESIHESSIGIRLFYENQGTIEKNESFWASIWLYSDTSAASARVKDLGNDRAFEKVKYLDTDEAVSGGGQLIFRKGKLVGLIQGRSREVGTESVTLAQDILSSFEVAPKWFISHPVLNKFEETLLSMLPKMNLIRDINSHSEYRCDYIWKFEDKSGRISIFTDRNKCEKIMYQALPKTSYEVQFLNEKITLFENYKGRLCKLICSREDSHLDFDFDVPSEPLYRDKIALIGKAFIKAVKDELLETVKVEDQ